MVGAGAALHADCGRGLHLAGPHPHCPEGEPVLTGFLRMEGHALAGRQLPISVPGDRREVHPASARDIGFRSTGWAKWENGTLDRFLEGLSAFADARVDDAPEPDQEQASWRLFADILRAATGSSVENAQCHLPAVGVVRVGNGVGARRVLEHPSTTGAPHRSGGT